MKIKLLFTILISLFVILIQYNTSDLPKRSPASVKNCEFLLNKVFESQFSYDSSVELELSLTGKVFSLLTTANGKISGLLGDIPIPESIAEWAEKRYPDITPEELGWDLLELEQKKMLLQYQAHVRNPSFYENEGRIIVGMKVKDKLKLSFEKNTEFLGKMYSRGEYEVDLSKVFSKVEYQSEGDIQKLQGIELHFRANQAAGNVSNDAWIFLDAVGIERIHQHIHIVEKIPFKELKESPRIYPVLMADFFRRVNLSAEFISIVNNHRPLQVINSIIEQKNGHKKIITHFGALTNVMLYEALNFLQALAKGDRPQSFDEFKMAWVGLRFFIYDLADSYGLEWRDIGGKDSSKLINTVLNAIQGKMHNKSWGITKESAQRWITHIGEPDSDLLSVEMAKLHYQWPIDKYLARIPKEFNLDQNFIDKLKIHIISDDMEKRNLNIKMVLHDWSNDTLYFANPDAQKSIRNAQLKAIQSLNRFNSDYVNYGHDNHQSQFDSWLLTITKDFLLESGIYHDVLESVGLKAKRY